MFDPLLSVHCSISLSWKRKNAWFYALQELRNVFTFLNGCMKIKEHFVMNGNYMEFKFPFPNLKFYRAHSFVYCLWLLSHNKCKVKSLDQRT